MVAESSDKNDPITLENYNRDSDFKKGMGDLLMQLKQKFRSRIGSLKLKENNEEQIGQINVKAPRVNVKKPYNSRSP